MENLKLYNWYGKAFDPILPESSNSLKAYQKQIQNIFSRQEIYIKSQQNRDKDLFLRARQKLSDNLKRNLASHKVAYKNKIAVLKDSVKKLSFANSTIPLLNFELKKLKLKLKDTQTYAKDFVYSLSKSADELNTKLDNIDNLKITTRAEELELFKKFTIYSIIKIYLQKHQDRDFDISKIKIFLLENEILLVEKINTNISEFFKSVYENIEQQRLYLFNKKQEIWQKYQKTYKLEKELYQKEKKSIILETQQKILNLEYKFKSKISELNAENRKKKEASLAKIAQQKESILQSEKINQEKINKTIAEAKAQSKLLQAKYKSFKAFYKQRATLQLCKDLYTFLVKNSLKINKIDFSFNNLSALELKQKNQEILKTLNAFKNEEKSNILVQNCFAIFLSKTNIFRNQFEFSLLLKSQYKKLIAKIKSSYSYEGKFNLEEAKALQERFLDSRLSRLKYRYEKIYAKTNYQLLLKSDLLLQEKAQNKQTLANIKQTFKENKASLKQKLKEKHISKIAYKNKIYEYKIDKKEAIEELKLQSKSLANKEILKTLFWRELSEIKVNKKLYESKITEATKSIPIETMKNLRWISLIFGLVFPGLAEICFFRQYLKGLLMSIFSIFAWVLVVPFSFGFYWDKMGGIPGFSDLGASKYNSAQGIFPDARLYLFGGVISVLLICFVIIYFLVSGLGAYRVAKHLEYGSRPSKWSHTKRWLNTSGFPWVISILGWVLMLFIVATPIITSILISFTNYGYGHEAPAKTVDWVGLKMWGYWWEFRENKMFLSLARVLGWTAIWTVFSTFLPIGFGIIIAVLTNSSRLRFKKIFRLIYILPWAIPAFVTLSFLKTAFKEGSDGYINTIMLALGLISEPKNWLSEIGSARILVIVVQTWIAYAWIFMLVTGNLQSIPKNIYESGSVDGAKSRQLFWYLTLPSLLLSIAPMLIGQFVGAFNNFTTISIFTGGGPAFTENTVFGEASTDIIISWVYKLTTGAANFEGNQAFAAALTTLAAVFSIAIGARGFIKSMSRRD
ncbi:ABC transporter permease subunit [Mesomycoplasma hyorhinis]|uniref:ABC transporter permease subunit n=1 Tax=Mesomycoplasma hyorhinis TaxID=2100 RepID=UPI003DA1FAF3